ncbi:MAG: HDIG domain-containing metalloprotein [Candidatus Omnitrophota bacterium]
MMNRKYSFSNFLARITRVETISFSLIALFVIASMASMFISPQFMQGSIQEGDIALKNTYAPYDFTYSWDIDEEKTQQAEKEALSAVPWIFNRDMPAEEKMKSEISVFFQNIQDQKESEIPESEKISLVRETCGLKLPDRVIKIFLESQDIIKLHIDTMSITEKIFVLGYLKEEDLKAMETNPNAKIVIFNSISGAEIERAPGDLLTQAKIRNTVEDYTGRQFEKDKRMRQPVSDLVLEYLRPNLVLDIKKTEALRDAALKKVKPVYYEWTVKKNELIIEKGKRINARHIVQIKQLKRFFRPGANPFFFMGVLLLFFLLGLIASIYVKCVFGGHLLRKTKDIAIVLLNMFLVIVLADLIMGSPQPSYFIPMAGIAMIITLLVNFETAFISVVVMSLLISILIGGKIELILVLLAGSTVGMFVVRGARRRGKILLAGLLAGAAKFAAICCIGLMNGIEMDSCVKDGFWGIASGLLSGFIVLGLLPVFEYLFKVPTNISLLELSDLNHPLLKKLSIEAPGTYHHSIMVGNLAEAACDSIGANSLLARVGSYYHDIGKIPLAEYFSENELGAGSRHSNLAPSMSSLIISKHVKEGVEIARQYKLNNTIIDFIKEHHGTSLIAYFYQKAIEQAEEGTDLKEDTFRYPGPRPQTKESAIVLLADSVEASSRSLDDPTPSSIRNLVRKIINNKFIDGQLDECDLTLRDMHNIADSFVRVLTSFFHTRLKYPEDSRKSAESVPDNGRVKKKGKDGASQPDDKNKYRKPK